MRKKNNRNRHTWTSYRLHTTHSSSVFFFCVCARARESDSMLLICIDVASRQFCRCLRLRFAFLYLSALFFAIFNTVSACYYSVYHTKFMCTQLSRSQRGVRVRFRRLFHYNSPVCCPVIQSIETRRVDPSRMS